MTTKPYDILLLEDNQDDEVLALRALRECGLPLAVRVAHDGVEGLCALGLGEGCPAGRLPDLVLSDYKMPKIDGCEVVRRARCDARLDGVPFVVLSSSDEDGDARRCLEAGASEFVTKPVGYGEYLVCMRDLARRWIDA